MTQNPKGRAIGIDYGLARIGVALSDERKIIASPHSVIQAEKKLDLTGAKVIKELQLLEQELKFKVDTIVIGMPFRMNGALGVIADEVKQFAELLKQVFSCPIILWDERLSSVQADRSLRECNMNRKKRAQVIDRVTAAIILQSYLDSQIK